MFVKIKFIITFNPKYFLTITSFYKWATKFKINRLVRDCQKIILFQDYPLSDYLITIEKEFLVNFVMIIWLLS